MNQNYISKWVHAFDTHCKYENCFYKQEHVLIIFPGKYFHRRNPSTKVWYERFWGHSSCREPDAKQHSQMPELKLVRYCQSMIHWSPGIVIIHVLISKNRYYCIFCTCDLNFILFSPPKLMAHIIAENIFKLIILYQHILIFDNKNNQPKKGAI